METALTINQKLAKNVRITKIENFSDFDWVTIETDKLEGFKGLFCSWQSSTYAEGSGQVLVKTVNNRAAKLQKEFDKMETELKRQQR